VFVLMLLWFQAATAFATETSSGPFSIVEQPVRIPPTSQDGTTEITLRSPVPQQSAPSLADVELPHPPAATVKFEQIGEVGQASNVWRFRVIVSGLVPANVAQQRYAVVSYGKNEKQTISYVLTNAQSNSSWSIGKISEPWVESSWRGEPSCIGFTVTPKDGPATNLVLGSSTLAEQNTKRAIGVDKLRICQIGHDCQSDAPINLPSNSPSRLLLCTTETLHGNFHGVLTLASTQRPDGDTILQSASFSSALAKVAGFLLLCVGVYAAWWTKVWARARLERDQSLMPAVLLRSYIVTLRGILERLPMEYRSAASSTSKSLDTLLDDLSDATLDGHQFLPPSFPSPYGYTVDAAGYKAYIEAKNLLIQLLSVVVREGVTIAAAKDDGNLTAAQHTLIVNAIKNIDAIGANSLLNLAQARQSIQTVLAGLQNALFPQAPGLAIAPAGTGSSPVETETLQIQMQSIGKGIWIVYGALTALSGLAVLVLNNPGFGVPIDFIFAFFWGFGLPTTLGALTPGSAQSALNISVSKA
jgi:hypothetical protein